MKPTGNQSLSIGGKSIPVTQAHTLVVGSGAAGLNAAVQLRRQGVEDMLVLTEGLDQGTSINTGSDKQTYYKLGMVGAEPDAPALMAESLFAGGSMHGDLALVEAALSPRAFLNLVNLGVPFPHDRYGQYVGYKTDHDPRQRATSIGPYTSREMCRALIAEMTRLAIPVLEKRKVVALLTTGKGAERRAAGVMAMTARGQLEAYAAENVVYAVGGPGGLYHTSVYPACHTGAIGTALLAGALAQSLPESQYGLASIKFRWNVSGTYMQVIPRVISTDADGKSNPVEFLRAAFKEAGELHSRVFLKGYQWPFDSRKLGGSSLIDILVYIETVQRGRRVFLDYRSNPEGFDPAALSEEARAYLAKSGATQPTPLARLAHMNPKAVALYKENGIDLSRDPLEIALCAQHQNGGLAATLWWESANIKHLFPVGEVNGSHGVARPGGSALNAGQVGSLRAAERIAHVYGEWTLEPDDFKTAASNAARELLGWLKGGAENGSDWRAERLELQKRMSRAGAAIRSKPELDAAVAEAEAQWKRILSAGCKAMPDQWADALTTRQLAFAQLVILDAVRFAVESGAGSRGSAMVLNPAGQAADPALGPDWNYAPEDPAFREKVLETATSGGRMTHQWVPRRPIPTSDAWFETAWADFLSGRVFRQA
jgi:succinate dehydrogenase/fumarate reductase flavoprotein subunit